MTQTESQKPALTLENEDISYQGFTALKSVNLTIGSGEKVALIGKSGAGKTTLLRRLYQLEPDRCAFIHQHYSLVSQLSVFHNIYMGRLDQFNLLHNIRNLIRPSKERLSEIKPIARTLALEDELFNRVGKLSGGQQQRVGIGRAFYRGSSILMADEPVSSLDRVQQEQVMGYMTDTPKTVISTLHSIGLARQFFDRIIGLKDQTVLFDLPGSTLTDNILNDLYA
jgi:phosphonate transport system ATP-binding protein